jgi:DNA-directed RNA polymerase specialized sigma24 family protein
VRGTVGDSATAGAVTESVFPDLPRTIQSYDPSEMRFDAWLLGVAEQAAIERVREIAPDKARDTLWALPPDVRYVLVLHHLVGLSTEEIAAQLGKTDGAVRQLDERGRAALQARRRRAAEPSAVA